jgi:hypothetical protein
MNLEFVSGCQPSYFVGENWLEMRLQLTDTFGTSVVGMTYRVYTRSIDRLVGRLFG